MDVCCPEAPQQWRALHPGEETPANGSVAGKRWGDLLPKSFSITAFPDSIRNHIRVAFTEMGAVGAGWSLSAAGRRAEQRQTGSRHSLLPTHEVLLSQQLTSQRCARTWGLGGPQ